MSNNYIGEVACSEDFVDKIMTDRSTELHNRIRWLRKEFHYTQQQVADYLDVNVSTYAHYEKGDRTPDVKKLALLAELYHLGDEMLGAKFPIETVLMYDSDDKARLRMVIDNCEWRKGDYQFNRRQYDRLKDAVEPLLKTRDEALHFPNVNTNGLISGQTVMSVKMDTEGERLIDEYLRVSHGFFDMM